MTKILITGANGQLGNEMREMAAKNSQYTYFFTDVAELNICDAEAIANYVAENEIDWIVNCAAYTAVDKAEGDSEFCDMLNYRAPAFLAEVIAKRGGRMIQISTDYVFDGTAYIPYTEDVPTSPNSVYGMTKRKGEDAVLEACSEAVIVRTSWLYSVFGNNFVKTMLRLGRERTELNVIFDQIGTPTYARDLAKVIFTIINQNAPAGIYHFSNEGVCSWYDFTKEIHRQAGITTCKVKPIRTADYPTAARRPHYSVLDKSKIKRTLGIEIPHWTESLQECLMKLNN